MKSKGQSKKAEVRLTELFKLGVDGEEIEKKAEIYREQLSVSDDGPDSGAQTKCKKFFNDLHCTDQTPTQIGDCYQE